MPTSRPLEPTSDEFRALLGAAGDFLADAVEALPSGRAYDGDGVPELLADPDLSRPPDEEGRPLDELLDVVERAASKGHIGPSGGHMAYIPGSGVVSAGVADLVADVLNRYTGLADASPGMVALEAHLVRWLADVFGLPDSGGGILTTGGSMAALSALVAARHTQLGEDFADGTVYVSDQAHASIAKAARIVGFPARAVRVVPSDADARLDLAALRRMITEDRHDGRRPAVVVGTAGTTNLGVIDPLPEIADIATTERLWFHVDAAYGGFFQLTERGRALLTGIERADSVVLDAHKGLFLPFGTGCLLVRDVGTLQESHAGDEAHYLQDLAVRDLPSFGDLSPELTRDFRGLRLWLPLHLHGVRAFRDALDEKLDLAQHAYDVLASDDRLQVLARPQLTVLGFHAATDDDTRRIVAAVDAEGRAFLSSTVVDGRYIGRVCILNHRTDQGRVDEALDAIRRHAAGGGVFPSGG